VRVNSICEQLYQVAAARVIWSELSRARGSMVVVADHTLSCVHTRFVVRTRSRWRTGIRQRVEVVLEAGHRGGVVAGEVC